MCYILKLVHITIINQISGNKLTECGHYYIKKIKMYYIILKAF